MTARQPYVSGALRTESRSTSTPALQLFLSELKAVRGLTAMQSQWAARHQAKGLLVDDYVLEKLLGEGHYGHCYLAAHLSTGQTASLRLLPSCFAAGEMARLARSLREYKKLPPAQVQRAVQSGSASGRPFIISHYVVGEDLASFVARKGPMTVDRALLCIIRALDGLMKIGHSFHGQLRPSKLLLNCHGDICIRDFALAKLLQQRLQSNNRQALIQSLPPRHVRYMAPELFLDGNNSSFRADIYALGCILYYLLTAESVYAGDDPLRIAAAHRESKIPSLTKKLREIPESLDHCFRKMIAKAPRERFESYEHCQATLRSIVIGNNKRAQEIDLSWEIEDEELLAVKQVRSGLKYRPANRSVGKLVLAVVLVVGVAVAAFFGYRVLHAPSPLLPNRAIGVQTVDSETAFTLP